jgi:uncharacterized protein YdeI (YjbR/CyaY-like superfamily)
MTEPLPFATPQDWNDWLAANHSTAKEIWVLYHRKGSGTPSIDWQQAVVEALVWGWIDGVRRTVSPTQWTQRFTPRKAGSSWSQINRAHAERLIAEGRMQPAGLAQVQIARENGRWDAAYSGAAPTELPQDFLDALAMASETARITFQTINARSRFAIYYRLTTAKRPETRTKRIAGFIETLARGEQPY